MSYLRPYQEQAIEAFSTRVTVGQENRLAVELATGLGKTVTGSALAAQWGSALVLTHTEEITGQWEKKLRFAAHGTGLTVGVVKGGRDESTADLVVASVPTVGNNAERLAAIGRRALTIADECHHAVAPSWTRALTGAGAWDGVPTLGLTATLARSDGAGLGQVWEDMVFSRGITWAIRQGYLLDIVPYRVRVPDVNAARTDEALDAMLADSIAPEAVVEAWHEHAYSGNPAYPAFPSTVVFAPLVKSAQAFADAFNAVGVKAEVIHGASPDREAILARYERGDTTVLCNAMVLTEGWDSPRTMCVVWARKAGGPLFIQGVGRGLRPWLDSPEAPPRESQRCTLICVTDTADASLNVVADLSDRPLDEGEPGKSLLDMEDEYDLGAGILDTEDAHYRGPVRVEQWDLQVQASSKAWKFTKSGAPFLPTAKRSQGYVFVVGSAVYAYGPHPKDKNRVGVRRLVTAPDPSLAMSVAEDRAQELGGDIGALLADKGRPWRKQVPNVDMVRMALRSGVTQREVDRILAQRASGKAGKLSDLTDMVLASRILDPIVNKILERA